MTRLAYALILTTLVVGCNNKPAEPPTMNGSVTPSTSSTPGKGFTKLGVNDTVQGTGPEAAKGDLVVLLYIGTLTNGTIFDNSMDESGKPNLDKEPMALTLGAGGVIKGWEDGLIGVKEGTVRKLQIPANLAYGAEGKDPIPPNTDLLFTIKILKVYKNGKELTIDASDVKTGSGAKVTLTSKIKFHYIGSLANGKVYDDQSKGMEVPVSKLVPSFRDAILGMMPGGERKISFPPNTPNPSGQLPAGQPFEYDVTVDEVK